MKKAIVLSLMLALFCGMAFAAPAGGGIKAGLSMADLVYSGGGESTSGDVKMGLMAGGFLNLPLGQGKMAVQPELLYVQKGTQEDWGPITAKMKLDFIQIPILLKAILGESKTRINFFAGPAVGILMSAKVSAEGESEDVKDEVNSTEFSVIGGMGVDIDKLCLEFRADLGLSNLAKDADGGYSIKSAGFGFLVGYSFM